MTPMRHIPLPRLCRAKAFLTFALLFVFGGLTATEALAQTSTWLSAQRVGDTAYFFFADRVSRYDLASRTWQTPILPPAGRAAITAGWTDGQLLLLAYGATLYRYDASGGGEQHLLNASGTIPAGKLFANATHIYTGYPGGYYGTTTSLARSTGAVVASETSWFYSTTGWSYAPSLNRLFGRSTGVSPSDILRMTLNPDGTFGSQTDSPYHGDYPSGTRTWVFPGDAKVVDSAGVVYSTGDLTYLQSFGTTLSDLQFDGDVPIVLSGNKLIAYTNTLLPVGDKVLGWTPGAFFLNNDEAVTFTFDATVTNAVRVAAVPLAELNAPDPGEPVSPVGVAFTPDDAFIDNDGVLHLFSKAQQSLFRWDTVTQDWLETLPLLGVADFVAYSTRQNAIYIAYPGGLVRKLDYEAEPLAETPFANLPTSLRGLAVADDYLFTVDMTGAWSASHSTYDSTGTRVDYRDWNYYSRGYLWSPVRQRMYHFRDDTSPNDLLSEEINANGTAYPSLAPGKLGQQIDSPLHSTDGFTHPIRISPDHSTIVLGSGRTHDAITLARRTESVANTFTDAAWFAQSDLRTLRTITGVTQFQQWTGSGYTPGTTLQLPGTAHRLFTLGSDRMLAILLDAAGRPAFYVLNPDNAVVAPAELAAPAGLTAVLTASDRATLGWTDVTGETGYLVQKADSPDGPWTDVGTAGTSATSFLLTGLTSGSVGHYRVIAKNGALSSQPSASVRLAFEAPAAPAGLAGTAPSSSSIVLTWSGVPNAATYLVERNLPPSTTWTQIGTATAPTTTLTSTGLSADTEYGFRVRASNVVGTSAYSEPVTVRTLALPTSAPWSIAATSVGALSVTVVWSNVNYETGYELERRLGASEWEPLATTAANITSFSDDTVQPLLTYEYRVRAFNSLGASGYSTILAVTTPALPPPTTPGDFTAQYLPGPSVRLTWSASTYATRYRIERQEGEAPWTTLATRAAPQRIFTDSTVQLDRVYSYRIVAEGEAGESSASVIRTVVTYPLTTVLADDFNSGPSPLVWEQVAGGTALDGGQGFPGSPVLWFGATGPRQALTLPISDVFFGYAEFSFRTGKPFDTDTEHWDAPEAGESIVLEYQLGTGAWQTLVTYDAVGAWTDYRVALPVADGTSLRLRWRQLAHSGPGYDTWAIENLRVLVYAPFPSPPPDFVLASAATDRAVSLFWAGISGAIGYTVERSADMIEWSQIARLPASQPHLVDRALLPATWYAYRVRTLGAGGLSEPSEVVWAQTYSQIQAWRLDNFGTASATGPAASLSAGDDGVANLLKYAFNLAAGARATTVKPGDGLQGLPDICIDPETGRLRVEYVRRRAAGAPGIAYHVEFSGDLTDWGTPAGLTETVESIDDLWERVVVLDPISPASGAPRFARVRVEEIEP